jgi:hypothetical protein
MLRRGRCTQAERVGRATPGPCSGAADRLRGLVVGGYAFNWRWTGFKANDTLWDWLKLLLVPTVLPLAVQWVMARQTELQALRPASGQAAPPADGTLDLTSGPV